MKIFDAETALHMAQMLSKREPNSFAYKIQRECFERLVEKLQKDSSDRPDGGTTAQSQQDYFGLR